METGETQRKPRHWWKSWIVEESFWRDVTTRTLAILISGAVLYVLALAGGYLSRPGVPLLVVAIGLGIVAALSTLWADGVSNVRKDSPRRDKVKVIIGLSSLFVHVLVGIVVVISFWV